MRIEHDDRNTLEFIDDAAISFMRLMAHRLNESLKKHGVEEAEIRESICYGAVFDMGYAVDAGWLMQGEKKLFPKICFAERSTPASDENLGAIERLHVPTEATSWHEYAAGIITEYFEENDEDIADIRRGSYNHED